MTVHGESVKDVLAAIDLNEAYDYMMDLASRKQPLNQSIIRDLNRLSIAKTHPDWANENRDRLHPVQYAADLHLKFVSIRPFRDSNGRTARLLMNLALTEGNQRFS
ncbi:death-on-curing family protein [Lactobacillus kitasatonis DSM 16761 = JCM 1039]|uniref:Death-on-curing family protein n=1 Tax=Lactobacillus kitasatonis DSM 16761 = JCM 1039 TaxID=1423767 RepID=A0A0R1VSM3_9LACO|nr:death-on-curing family protein [Lactobacillus kitasatonis DSM 16761 = JCM 1039]